MRLEVIEYPALVYKGSKKNLFIANCIMKNISGYGNSESKAIANLTNALKNTTDEYIVKVKPVYELKYNNKV